MAREYYKCHYNQCSHDGQVHVDDMVEIIENGKKKRFHKDCLNDYNFKKEDRKYLDKLSNFISKNYLDNQKLTTGMIRRLQALRADLKFIKRGDKIPFKPNDGNSYKLIVLTVLNYRNEIDIALRGKEFRDYAQKMNYICAILEDKIPKVKEALKHKKREQAQLNNITDDKKVFEKVPEFKQREKQEDRLKNRFDDMW